MSSSDSDDDCYGNIAQKLQSMKNVYKEDKIESMFLLDSSSENVEKKRNDIDNTEANISLASTENDEITLDSIIENNSNRPKRQTRSSTKKKKTEESTNNQDTAADTSNTTIDNATSTSRRRGGNRRGRNSSRGRRGTGRRRTAVNTSTVLPTYSVGNTEDYPDQSDNQQLFSHTASNDIVVIDDTEVIDDNEELSVKVYWQNSEVFKFMIRRYQKLTQIFDFFSKKESVPIEKLLFMYSKRILNANDTPDSINYHIVKFIEGGIVKQTVTSIAKKDVNTRSGLIIKFQCQNVKKPFETTIQPNEKMSMALVKCAEHLEMPLCKLKFIFDGDLVNGKATPTELDLEGGECIDVQIIS